MGIWIFIMIMDMIIPIIMLVVSQMFIKKMPKHINSIVGYRTTMSMKNKETWKFAHEYCGKLWRVHGGIMLAISIIVMLLVLGKGKESIAIVGGVLCSLQCIWLVVTIIPVEKALRKNFDKNGNRKVQSDMIKSREKDL